MTLHEALPPINILYPSGYANIRQRRLMCCTLLLLPFTHTCLRRPSLFGDALIQRVIAMIIFDGWFLTCLCYDKVEGVTWTVSVQCHNLHYFEWPSALLDVSPSSVNALFDALPSSVFDVSPSSVKVGQSHRAFAWDSVAHCSPTASSSLVCFSWGSFTRQRRT